MNHFHDDRPITNTPRFNQNTREYQIPTAKANYRMVYRCSLQLYGYGLFLRLVPICVQNCRSLGISKHTFSIYTIIIVCELYGLLPVDASRSHTIIICHFNHVYVCDIVLSLGPCAVPILAKFVYSE